MIGGFAVVYRLFYDKQQTSCKPLRVFRRFFLLLARQIVKRERPAPLLPRPQNWYLIKRVVAVYIHPLDKYGRVIPNAQPEWWIVPRWLKDLYESFAEMGRKDGAIWGSYDYIAGLQGVSAERARQQVQAMVHIGWTVKQHRTNQYGWYDTNLYGLVDPLAPKYALAIMIRTDDRNNRYQTIKLSQQVRDIPEFSFVRSRSRQRERKINEIRRPLQPVILPQLYQKIAEAEGLTDPRWQGEAWRRFELARKKKGTSIKKPGAYWRGLVRHVREEAKDSQIECGSNTTELSEPGKERERRRSWILGRAMRELLIGTDIGEAATTVFNARELLAYCHYTVCSFEDIVRYVQEAQTALVGDLPDGA
jgi:hypothetical protein